MHLMASTYHFYLVNTLIRIANAFKNLFILILPCCYTNIILHLAFSEQIRPGSLLPEGILKHKNIGIKHMDISIKIM